MWGVDLSGSTPATVKKYSLTTYCIFCHSFGSAGDIACKDAACMKRRSSVGEASQQAFDSDSEALRRQTFLHLANVWSRTTNLLDAWSIGGTRSALAAASGPQVDICWQFAGLDRRRRRSCGAFWETSLATRRLGSCCDTSDVMIWWPVSADIWWKKDSN